MQRALAFLIIIVSPECNRAVGCDIEHTEVERFLSCLRCDNHPAAIVLHMPEQYHLPQDENELAVDVDTKFTQRLEQACPEAGTIVMHTALLLLPFQNARMPLDQFRAGAS